MRILVTGANGLVGSRVAARLALQGHEVFATGRGARRCEGDFIYEACELTQPEALDALFAQARPELILHCAAMTEVDACEAAPEAAFAINVSATAQLATLSRRTSAHMVYVSSDYVFDGEAGPYDEDALPNPRGVYALTKHRGEQAVRAGQPVPVFEDQRISPTLALNVAELLAELGTRRLAGVWHLAGAEVVSRVELGERVCRVFGFWRALLQPVKMADVKLPVPRPARAGLLVEKAKRALTAQPLGLDASLRIFRDEFRAG